MEWDEAIEMTAQRCWGDDWRDLPLSAKGGIEAAIDEHLSAFFLALGIDKDAVLAMSPHFADTNVKE